MSKKYPFSKKKFDIFWKTWIFLGFFRKVFLKKFVFDFLSNFDAKCVFWGIFFVLISSFFNFFFPSHLNNYWNIIHVFHKLAAVPIIKTGEVWWDGKVYEGLWWYGKVYDGMWRCMMVWEGLWWYGRVYDGMWRCMMVWEGVWWYGKVYDGMGRCMMG